MCRNIETYVQPQNMDEILGKKITQQSIFKMISEFPKMTMTN